MPHQTENKRFSHQAWEQLLDETIRNIRGLATIKGGEYAAEGDRLDNFRRQASEMGLCQEQVWRVYAGKHWDSINTWIRDRAEGRARPRSEPMLGRADDLIVYAILLKAMMLEAEGTVESPEISIDKAPGPVAPEVSCDHRWMKYDRHTDVCVFCNTMRPHQNGRSG